MPATATKSRHSTNKGCALLELAVGHGRVDTTAGVIYEAKIVGLESRNVGRTIGLDPKVFGEAVNKPYGYSKRALESAIHLYEGAAVRLNHPQTRIDETGRRVVTQRTRDLFETVGQLKNVKLKADGLYGDIHLIQSNTSTPTILEMAERMPNKIALSHNAFGDPILKSGKAVIDSIKEVYSVDLVGDKPGTTNGLFELALAEIEMPTYQQVIETLSEKTQEAYGKLLLECPGMMGPTGYNQPMKPMGMSMGANPAAMAGQAPAQQPGMADPMTAMEEDKNWELFRQLVLNMVDDETTDRKTTVKRIDKVLRMYEELTAPVDGLGSESDDAMFDESEDELSDDSEEEFSFDDEEDEDMSAAALTKGKEEQGKKKPMFESAEQQAKSPEVVQLMEDVAVIKAENDALKADKHARQLLETAKREVTDVRVAAVIAMKSDDERKLLIETWAAKEEAPAPAPLPRLQRPLYSAPLMESVANGEKALAGKELIAAISR